jgi:hypothetical protein
MQILVNTDSNIDGREEFTTRVKRVVESALHRFSDRITRVEVHLSDQNGEKSGQEDKRCVLEARLEGRRPTAVTHHAGSIGEAIEGAAGKLKRSLETTVQKEKEVQ